MVVETTKTKHLMELQLTSNRFCEWLWNSEKNKIKKNIWF